MRHTDDEAGYLAAPRQAAMDPSTNARGRGAGRRAERDTTARKTAGRRKSTGRNESVVVYTCITADYDIPIESRWALRCPHICFTDDPALRSATWSVRPVQAEGLDPRRRSRHPKVLPHLYLGEYDISIWIDASARLLEDPLELARRALADGDFAAFRHPKRDCAYLEAQECERMGKDAEDRLKAQIEAYASAGLPRNAGLWEATVLVRRHRSGEVVKLMDAWWNEVLSHSCRDQISLAYLAWRLKPGIRTLGSRAEPGAAYKIRQHHSRRGPLKRAHIRVVEWIRSHYTRLKRVLASAPVPDPKPGPAPNHLEYRKE